MKIMKINNLKLIYNRENRFFAVNYNLQMISDIDINDRQVDQYFEYAKELGITMDTKIKKPWEVMA